MLAIVIPYYKLTFFETTLQSLENQTDKRFKVYIGDDASPENPSLLLKKYKNKFNFLYHRFEANLGNVSLTKHWERCIDMTSDEEWIMILGDDDMLSATVVETWYSNYSAFYNKSNVIRFSSQMIFENDNTTSKIYTNPIWESSVDAYLRKCKGLTRSSLSEYVFSKESYHKFGFKDYMLSWHSDDMAWLDFSDEKPIYSINNSNVLVRVSEKSISGKLGNKKDKQLALTQFFNDILTRKLYLFENNQRLKMLLSYEMSIKRIRNLTIKEWCFLSLIYINNFKIISFTKFIRRFILAFFKRNKFN